MTASSYSLANSTYIDHSFTYPIKGVLPLGNYLLYKVVVPQPTLFDDVHTYNKNFTYALDSWGDSNSIIVPSFNLASVSVVNSLPSPTPTPTPTPSASVTESSTPTPTPTPTVTETSTLTPTPSSSPSESSIPIVSVGSNSVSSTSVIPKDVTPIAIQSSGVAILKTPDKNGDLTWKKAKDVTTTNSEWKLKRNNLANNGNFLETNISNSTIKVITKGDAFTLRFVTGKNRGNIQINVDGKKLATFSTKANKAKIKVKSWIGIGTGKHTIEIIPLIETGQSVGIDAIQVAKAV